MLNPSHLATHLAQIYPSIDSGLTLPSHILHRAHIQKTVPNLLGISIQSVKLRPQLSSNFLLRWFHGSFVLSHSGSPQRLCVRVVLQGVQTQEGREGITNSQLFLFSCCQQAKKLFMNGAQRQNLRMDLSFKGQLRKFFCEMFNNTK